MDVKWFSVDKRIFRILQDVFEINSFMHSSTATDMIFAKLGDSYKMHMQSWGSPRSTFVMKKIQKIVLAIGKKFGLQLDRRGLSPYADFKKRSGTTSLDS